MAEFGSRGREDRLPARRSGSRFPERQTTNAPVYSITDARRPQTEYVYLRNKGAGSEPGGGRWTLRWVPPPRRATHSPTWVPGFLLNDKVLLYSWLGSMAVIAVDEWHNNGILPRPARLWYTSLTYFLLMGLGMIDPMIPIANALGIGFFITLIYQYNTGSGQFAKGA